MVQIEIEFVPVFNILTLNLTSEPPQGLKFGPLVRIRTILESGPKMVQIWAFSGKWSKNALIQ